MTARRPVFDGAGLQSIFSAAGSLPSLPGTEVNVAYRRPYYNEDHKLVRYGPVDFIKDSIGAVIRFFSPSNIKFAFRSVTAGFREFAAFFVALTLLQSLFWMIWLRNDSYAAEAKKEAYSGEGYNLIVEGIDEEVWADLYNKQFVFAEARTVEERGYERMDRETYFTGSAEYMIRLKFVLTEDSVEYCGRFARKYTLNREEFSLSYGERTGYLGKIASVRGRSVLTTVLAGLLAAAILMLLFYIRTNRNKFMYGIFVSFGGGFSKLMETAGWEMFAVAILTFLPSAGLSCLAYFLIARFQGAEFVFLPQRIPVAVLWILCAVLLAAVPGIFVLTRRTPVALLTAADNSNYVSSPRRSFRIFGKSFPYHYELYGFVRFRKYYAMVLLSAVLFTSLFSCGLFFADMKRAEGEAAHPAFTVTSGGEEIDPLDIDALADIPGVKYISFGSYVFATELRSIVLLSDRQAAGISSKTVKDRTTGLVADNNVRYGLLSERLVTETAKGMWSVEGDLSKVAGSDIYVAVSTTVSNRYAMDFRVGDSIRIGVFESAGRPLSFEKPDRLYALSMLVNEAYFDYFDVTVAAVVDDGDTSDTYCIYLSDSLFEKVTKRDASVTEADIYLDQTVRTVDLGGIRESVVKIMTGYDGYDVKSLDAVFDYNLYKRAGERLPIVICAAAILLISPMVWIFSQAAFSAKRETEIYMLSAMGGTDRDLWKLFLFSGGILALLASAVTAALGSLINYGVFCFANYLLPSLGMGESVRYRYLFSVPGFLICVLLSAAGALLSTCLPFITYKKNRDRTERAASGEVRRG